ncbi:MAG: putative teichuronic acid biosynthesis glycosyltransferase TuaH [Bacteroidetes bacterium ADurb.Bin408]|nr:MAG: putative teichuronic acid biosynthesis glycosyltransferase TuaH [Bacteroidetes bacterium ADurb.Bin408]
MGLFACLYCRIKGIKYFFCVSDDWDHVPQRTAACFLWKSIIKPVVLKYAHAVLPVSHKQYDLCLKKNKNTFLLPNGVELPFIKKIDNEESNNESETVNFIAHLRDWYDFDLLTEIFIEIPRMTLNIFGDGPLKNELIQKTAHIPNIKVLGSRIHEDTARLLNETAIGLLPLKKTILNDSTCPIKLFDYWAARKAVVATPTEELKILGSDCLLFATTKDEWIKQITFLLNNPERRKILGHTGREKVEKTYNYDAITEVFLRITKRLLKTE